MKCTFSTPLRDNEISALVDGDRSDTLIHHIENCAYCKKRFLEAIQIEEMLTQSLYRADCPEALIQSDYHLQLLEDHEHDAVEQHLKVCSSCRAELDELSAYLEADENRSVSRSSDKIVPFPRRIHKLDLHERTVANVRQDMKGKPTNRQLEATADGIRILLYLQQTNDGIAIEGSLFVTDNPAKNWTGSLVEVYREDALLGLYFVDLMKSFHCEPIPPGVIDLRITSPEGHTLIITDLQISV